MSEVPRCVLWLHFAEPDVIFEATAPFAGASQARNPFSPVLSGCEKPPRRAVVEGTGGLGGQRRRAVLVCPMSVLFEQPPRENR